MLNTLKISLYIIAFHTTFSSAKKLCKSFSMYMFQKVALPDVFLCIYSGWWERGSGGLCLGRPNLHHRSCTYGGPLPVWWKCECILCWWASLIVFIRLNLISVSILWSYSPLNWTKKDNNWAPNQHRIISKWSCDTEHKNCITLIFSKKQSVFMWMYVNECEHLM